MPPDSVSEGSDSGVIVLEPASSSSVASLSNLRAMPEGGLSKLLGALSQSRPLCVKRGREWLSCARDTLMGGGVRDAVSSAPFFDFIEAVGERCAEFCHALKVLMGGLCRVCILDRGAPARLLVRSEIPTPSP